MVTHEYNLNSEDFPRNKHDLKNEENIRYDGKIRSEDNPKDKNDLQNYDNF